MKWSVCRDRYFFSSQNTRGWATRAGTFWISQNIVITWMSTRNRFSKCERREDEKSQKDEKWRETRMRNENDSQPCWWPLTIEGWGVHKWIEGVHIYVEENNGSKNDNFKGKAEFTNNVSGMTPFCWSFITINKLN